MGVRTLESFMKEHVPEGFVDVSIIEECQKFIKENAQKPILLIDFMQLMIIILTDSKEVLLSGRHKKYLNILNKFLSQLEQYAKLIFFKDGPTFSSKISRWIDKGNQEYETTTEIMSCVSNGQSLDEIIDNFRKIPYFGPITSLIEDVSKKYGKIILAVSNDCGTEMAKYAKDEPRVLAILSKDSDFLIYPGSWKYFSLGDVNIETLETKEFSRDALRRHLELSDFQLNVFSTLNGNDVISFDDTKRFHYRLMGRVHFSERIRSLAEYVKNLQTNNKVKLSYDIAQSLFDYTSERNVDKVMQSLNMYNLNYLPVTYEDPLINLCLEKLYNFSLTILLKKAKNLTVDYCMYRNDNPNFYETSTALFRKQIGILLKERNEHPVYEYEILSKMSSQDSYRKFSVKPIYPRISFPPLIRLLKRSRFKQFDNSRVDLLKWLISEEKMQRFDLNLVPRNYLQDVLALTFMCDRQHLTESEADIILLSIKKVETDAVPDDLECPHIINERAFRIAMLFLKFHQMIGRCLEVVGLKDDFSKIINFDGFMFHTLYLKYENEHFNSEALLADLRDYQLYRN